MSDLMMALWKKWAETCLSFDSLYLNKVLLCFDLPTLSIVILHVDILASFGVQCRWVLLDWALFRVLIFLLQND